jgi:hypothetical protein
MALPSMDDADARLVQLVGPWMTLPDVAHRFGVDVSRVRRALADGELLAMRVAGVVRVPELFLVDPAGDHGGHLGLPELKGTLTVLSDAGFRPSESVSWLFTPDDSLREGRPIDALRAGRKTEVRRRAQAMAF